MKNKMRFAAIFMAVCLGTGLLAGCGTGEKNTYTGSAKGTTEKKTFVFGDTTFNPENEEPDVNPHNAYAGWACIRYGVGVREKKIPIPEVQKEQQRKKLLYLAIPPLIQKMRSQM